MIPAPAEAAKSTNFATAPGSEPANITNIMKEVKIKKFVLAILTAVFVITGCPDSGGGGGDIKDESLGTRKFWAQNIATQTFYQINADKLAENSRCEVWAEKGSGVTAATANNVANAYNIVYTKMMNTFGYQINVNLGSSVKKMNTMEIAHYLATGKTNDAKLTILLFDIKDGYTSKDDPFVGGYFYAVDLLENNPNDPKLKYSNELDMIYLDTYPSVPGSASSNRTLAHEMQHLMNFVSSVVYRKDSSNTVFLMDTWIDEGLSSAAEWVYSGKHPEDRWQWYIDDKSGLIARGNNFYVWGNRDDNPMAALDDYATVYLFFQYLRLQSVKPDDIYFDIHTSKFSDYRAVTAATDINSSHKDNWQLLLRDWHAANFTNTASGLYGYRNDSTLKTVKAPMFPDATPSVYLYPGEGVYSKINGTDSVPSSSGNIKYAGLNSTGAPVESGGTASVARLTYNVNTNTEGGSETGSTTSIAPSVGITIPAGSGSVQIGSTKFSGTFKVDADYFRRRNGNDSIPDNGMRSIFSNNTSRSINKDNNTLLRFDVSTLERVFIDE